MSAVWEAGGMATLGRSKVEVSGSCDVAATSIPSEADSELSIRF